MDTQHPTTTKFREVSFEFAKEPDISEEVDNPGPTHESPTLDMKRKREELNVAAQTKPSKQVKFKDDPNISTHSTLKLERRTVTPFKP